jgi:hypothetical protein
MTLTQPTRTQMTARSIVMLCDATQPKETTTVQYDTHLFGLIVVRIKGHDRYLSVSILDEHRTPVYLNVYRSDSTELSEESVLNAMGVTV